MKKLLVACLPVCCALALLAAEPKIPPMPDAVTGNAVASLRNGIEVYSMMGLGTKKTWDAVTNNMFMMKLSSGKWMEGKPVPGVAGRLGASAVGARGQIFVFGGYVVDGQGNEITVGDVNSYVPEDHRWYRAADIPIPVDSAVIGLTHDRYIYIIGGRAKNGPVNNVQVYDAEKNTWSQATAFPGTPVYGHAGGIADETIVYVDGAKKEGTGYARFRRVLDGKDRQKRSQQDRMEQAAAASRTGPLRHRGQRLGAGTQSNVFGRNPRPAQLQRPGCGWQTGTTFARNLRLRASWQSLGNHYARYVRRARGHQGNPVYATGAICAGGNAEQLGSFGARVSAS